MKVELSADLAETVSELLPCSDQHNHTNPA